MRISKIVNFRFQSNSRFRRQSSDNGVALVVVLFFVTVATVIGVGLLNSTQTSSIIAGRRGAAKSLSYEAQEGLYRAFRRLQEIVDPALTDSLYTKGRYTAPEKTINYLVYNMPFEGNSENDNYPCPAPFDPTLDLNSYMTVDGDTSNTICNFMGTELPDTQVQLVRKVNYVEGNQSFAVFLINSIARDEAARIQIVQGVAIVPYSGAAPSHYVPVGYAPYLANVLFVAD